MYAFFRNLNAARRAAIAAYPLYLDTALRPHQLNNHSIALSKAPLLTLLSNYGSGTAAIGLYIPPSQTGFKPLLPIIDVLSGQILSTDPRGGLTVPVVGGEPRVFLPLGVYRGGDEASASHWAARPMSIDTDVRLGGPVSPSSPTSPITPGSPPARRRNRNSMPFNWLSTKKNHDL